MNNSSSVTEISQRIIELATSSQQHSFIITGKFGSGKSRVMSRVAERLASSGYEVFFPPPLTSPETLKYDPFNRILDSITGKNEVRELSGILRDLEALWNGGRKFAILLEGMNLMSDPTRYLFTFLAEKAPSVGMILLGSVDTDRFLWNGDVADFLQTHRVENISSILETKKPVISDFSEFLGSGGYSLDYDLIQDLYRLADGNFRILDYTLKYYRHKNIIDSNGRVNDSLYRSFLIPANIGQFLLRILDEASEGERDIIALLSLCETGLDLHSMATLLKMAMDDLQNYLKNLKSQGLITVNMGTGYFTSYFLKRYAADRISPSILERVALKVSVSSEFKSLPLQSRINILIASRDYEQLSTLIRNEWRSFVRKFTSVYDLRRFAESMLGKFADEETNSILNLVLCNSIYNSDDLEGARSCYEQIRNNSVDQVSTSLTLASIYSALGNHESSVSILETALTSGAIESGARGLAHVSLAEDYFAIDNLSEARKLADAAMKIAREDRNQEIEARAMTVMGSISGYSGDYDSALDLYGKSLAINMKLGIWLQITRNLNNMQAVLEYLGRYTQARDTGLDLIPYTYLTGDRTMRAAALLNTAYVFDILGEALKAAELSVRSLSLSERRANHMQAFRSSLLAYFSSMKMFDFSSSVSHAEKCLELASTLGTKGTREFSLAIRHMARYFGGKVMDAGDEDLLMANYSLDPRDGVQFNFLVSLYFLIRGDLYKAGDAFNRAMDTTSESQEPYLIDVGLALSALNLYFTSDFKALDEIVQKKIESQSEILNCVLLGCSLALERRKKADLRSLWMKGEDFMEKTPSLALGSLPICLLIHNIIQEGNAEDLTVLPLSSLLKKLPPPISSYFRIRIIDRGIST